MEPDLQRDLTPRADVLHLIHSLDHLKITFLGAAKQWQLLDADTGDVPAEPSYTELLQHAVDAQDLSRDVVRLAADFARSPHSTNCAGHAVLAHLATAATMSSHAAPHFAETAETALSLSRAAGPITRRYRGNSMVIDHATARAYLRRTSESLGEAAKELHAHLDLHRFLPAPAQQAVPAPPSPPPNARHR
ncbi:hypothetical protein ACMZ5E_00330 [Streptomyces rhizosphaericola]|uniref:hypothetical protein n=1 Tax=Streptomyces rhizosphaericola TaxID=2564098 RepID=UPI0039EFD47A